MITERVKKDARTTVGSIYRMNAPHAIGYLFTCAADGSEVAQGMYADRRGEVDPERWDGFLQFSDNTIYDLSNPRSRSRLGLND